MDKIAVTTPGAQLAGFPGPRGAMRVGPGVSVPVFAVPGKQNPTWVRIRPNNEGNPPHLTQLSTSRSVASLRGPFLIPNPVELDVRCSITSDWQKDERAGTPPGATRTPNFLTQNHKNSKLPSHANEQTSNIKKIDGYEDDFCADHQRRTHVANLHRRTPYQSELASTCSISAPPARRSNKGLRSPTE